MEEIPYGTYIIEKPDNDEIKQKTNFTGYDYMIKFNVPYKNRVSYPIKASELLADVCNQVGLQIGNTDFTNADYMILGNPFTNGEDCRTVLSNIAQLAGTFVKIGRDNKVYIPTLKNCSNLLTVKYVDAMTVKELNLTSVKVLSGEADNAEETLDGYNYGEDFGKNNQWGGLNSLILAVSDTEGENTALDDKGDIEKNGLSEITIQDNYFLIDQAEREKVIVPLWNMLKGLKYLPFKTSYYGYPYLDTGDMIYIQDTKDNGYVSYVFNHSFTFNGAFNGSLETSAMTKTQTAYKNTFDVKSKVRKVELSVDKINGEIKAIVEEQTELGKLVTSATTKVGELEQSVTLLTNDNKTIKASLDLKVDKSKLISEINASADVIRMTAGRFIFESNNFSINSDGKITATAGTIGGFTLSNAKFSTNINGKYNYSEYDVRNVFNSVSGHLSANSILKIISDYNSNGAVDYNDVQSIYDIVKNGYSNNKTITGSFEINAQDPKNAIVLKQSGTIAVSIGLGGINTNLLSAKSIVVSDGSYSATDQAGVAINGETGEMILYDKSNRQTIINPSKVQTQQLLVKSKELAFPEILYDNASGTTGTISLSKSIANYSFIEIYYTDDYNYDDCVRIFNNKSSSISCALTSARASDSNMNVYATLISISGSYVRPETTFAGSYSSYSGVVNLTNILKIKKILGYL